jgi:uncharacterized protein (DUF1697 family)
VTTFVALLRAVNVGGTGKLPMAELTAMCEAEGFARVRTYIASGNVVFASDRDAAGVKAAIERRLAAYAGRPVGVLVRTADELAAAVAANPFAAADGHAPNRTLTVFLDGPPPADAAAGARHRTTERIALGARELYVSYGDAMAGSKLLIPAARAGTARNMNTVAALAELARRHAGGD